MPRQTNSQKLQQQQEQNLNDPLYLLQTDFRYFLTAVWAQLNLPAPTKAQLCMAEYLQNGPKRLIIEAFRGVGKSWITGAFALWHLFRDPEIKILMVSASKERADNQSIWIQKLILDTAWLSHLKPRNDDARWSRVSFDVNCSPSQAPSVKSVGIGGQMTGSRADILIADDVEVANNSLTDMMREKLLSQVTEFESILTPKPTSRVIYLGTPQTTFTVYKTLAQRGYAPLIWPARIPEDPNKYEGCLAQDVQQMIDRGLPAGTPTDPERFDHDELLQRESRMGRSTFSLQFQLDTTLSDALKFPLKFSDMIVTSLNPKEAADNYIWSNEPSNRWDLPCMGLPGDKFYKPASIQGEWTPYTESICFIDPSGRGTDETAAAFMSQKNGFLFLHQVYASRDGYQDNVLLDILRLSKHYNCSRLVIESNFGDGMVAELFKKHIQQSKLALAVEEVRANVRKEDRIIDSLEPVLNQHRLVVDAKIFEWDQSTNPDLPPEERIGYFLGYQFSRICREKGAIKHDDRLDSIAGAVKYFTDSLAISAYEQVKTRKQEDFHQMLKLWQDDPEAAVSAMAFGMNLEQRQRASSMKDPSSVPRWIQGRP
jgi:hypothetical protein